MPAAMDSAAWNRRYADRELVWTSEPNRFLVAEAAALAPGRALDLACGEGRNAVWLAARGWRVTGVDFSEAGLEKARRLAETRGARARWIAADLLDYTPEPRAFDLVLVFYLQLPAAQRRPIVRAAAGAVAPGGLLLLVAHDSTNLEHGYGGPQIPPCSTPPTTWSPISRAPACSSSGPRRSGDPWTPSTGNGSRLTRSCARGGPRPGPFLVRSRRTTDVYDPSELEDRRFDARGTGHGERRRQQNRVARRPAGRAGPATDALLEPWLSCRHERLGELRISDRQTHPGRADPGLPLPTK